MDRHREDDRLDLRGNGDEVDVHALVVALALTGEVVAGVLDGAVRRTQVVVEDEMLVGQDLAVLARQQCTGVEIEVRAGRRAHVPAETHRHRRQVRSLLRQRNVAALGQAHTHTESSRSMIVAYRHPSEDRTSRAGRVKAVPRG